MSTDLEKIMSRLDRIEQITLIGAKDVLNMDDAHIITGISMSDLYKKTSAREIPHYKKGKRVYFDRVELESWLKENRITTIDEIETAAATYNATRRLH